MKIYGCCDNQDCSLCYGSGVVEVAELKELADEVLRMISICDLNQDDCRKTIRELAERIKNGEQP